MYKAIIFDFFDVVHADPFHRWLKLSGLQREGQYHEISRRLDLGITSDKEFYQELAEASGQTPERVAKVFNDTNLIDHSVVEVIKRLKPNYKIGLLSNSSSEYLRPILEIHQIDRLFDAITISAEVKLAKPDPAIFEHVLNALDVSADQAIFIDDNIKNVEAATTLGIRSIVYTNKSKLEVDLGQLLR